MNNNISDQALAGAISACARILLDHDSAPCQLRDAVIVLHTMLTDCAGELDGNATQLISGKALSARDAARCVLDHQRTTEYVRAIDQAIDAALHRWPQSCVRVLYAGCGPWASLLLLLAQRWQGRVSIHLVDVHSCSLQTAVALFARIGQTQAISAVSCRDASTLQIEPDQRPHVLVAEVMQRALEREPQVAVTAQLAPQLIDGGVMVPHCIEVNLVLARFVDEFGPDAPRVRIPLMPLIALRADTATSLRNQIAIGADSLPAVAVTVPDDIDEHLDLMLCTRIEVAPGCVLGDYDSGITYPKHLHALGHARRGQRLLARYRLGPDPGFVVDAISDACREVV